MLGTSQTGLDRLQSYLREHGVCFAVRHHPLPFSTRHLPTEQHVEQDRVLHTLVVRANGRLVMVVLPARARLAIDRLAAALRAPRVEVVEDEYLGDVLPGCEIGAWHPFGTLYSLPVYVDQRVANKRQIEFRAGTHTLTIALAYAEFARLVQPIVVDVADVPVAA
jgi:Ala-tRNA(Pro) deacylase